jgi:hypothetical protein
LPQEPTKVKFNTRDGSLSVVCLITAARVAAAGASPSLHAGIAERGSSTARRKFGAPVAVAKCCLSL